MNTLSRWSALLAGALWLSSTAPVSAAIYKCTDPDGSVSYSQTPCAVQQQPAGVIATRTTPQQDCRIARNFAADVATSMRRGDSSEAQFQRFGGMNAIPATAMGLISYIYSYQGEPDISTARITALSTARCETRSFGSAECTDFPAAWIDEMGGCDLAADPASGQRPRTATRPDPRDRPDAAAGPAIPEGLDAAEATDVSLSEARARAQPAASGDDQCVRRVQNEIAELRDRMRQPGSVQQQNTLNQRRNELRRALSRC